MTDSPGPLSRRGFLAAIAAAAAIAVSPSLVGEARPADAEAATTKLLVPPSLDLADVQGNILAGFNKDFGAFVGLRFPSVSAGRAWLAALASQIASAAEVSAFNAAFKAVALRKGLPETTLSATWLNVAFTYTGLKALGVSAAGLAMFPPEFRGGMEARAGVLGDVGPSAPAHWPVPLRQQSHAMVIIGADQSSQLTRAISQQTGLAAAHGIEMLWVQKAAVRADQPGFEHFGYRDGISQPGIRGYTPVSNPSNPNQGEPGQDLVWPGEFLIGHPTQAGPGKPITATGPTSRGGPPWATNGSFLVFRRLRQDVAGFRAFEHSIARSTGMSDDLAGAKLVGRFKSGAPLEIVGNQAVDPGLVDTSLLTAENVNNFDYAADADGAIVPLSSHIRKANPRNESLNPEGLADTLTRRIIRRGIPFGGSLPAGTPANNPIANPPYPNDRGLFFLAYQSSIARQFEFMQSHWVNNSNFPTKGAGQDPVTSQISLPGTFTIQGNPTRHIELMARFVTTTGGDYFFQPALSALRTLSAKK